MANELISNGDERQAACDKAELVLELDYITAEQQVAAEAVIYAYRFDGIMTADEVAKLS